jgi:hypothetical protein
MHQMLALITQGLLANLPADIIAGIAVSTSASLRTRRRRRPSTTKKSRRQA